MKNKKTILIIALFCCLLLLLYYFLFNDNQKVVREHIFSGENENWIAEYKVQEIKRKNQQPEIVKKTTLKFIYKNSVRDIENINTLEYSFKDGDISSKTIEKFSSLTSNKNKEFRETSYSSLQKHNIEMNYTKYSIVEVEIGIDGNKEKLLLELIK